MLPAYRALERVDNVNFSRRTLWQGDVNDGEVFDPLSGGARGVQYVADATDLADFPDEKYDAVLASHVLEHIANPFRALSEWRRVLRPDGFLLLVLPDGARTFDHRRPVTTMAHLEADLREGKEEDDLGHLEEVIALDDRRWSDEPDSLDEMRLLWQKNFQTRTLHHHVFDGHLLSAVVSRAGFEVDGVEHVWPYHIVVIARRRPTIASIDVNEHTPVADDH